MAFGSRTSFSALPGDPGINGAGDYDEETTGE